MAVALVLCVPVASQAASWFGYNTVVRASVASGGVQANNHSQQPGVSETGRFVAFYSAASNLVPGDTNGLDDAFVHDLVSGETTRVSVSSTGVQSDRYTGEMYATPAVSANGRYVAFCSGASNFTPVDNGGSGDIFVRDLVTGETTCASVSSSGELGNSSSEWCTISADGRYVAFSSNSTNLVANDTAGDDVFVRDLVSGTTSLASVSSSGVQGGGLWPSMSADGRHVAFLSDSPALVPGDANGQQDIFVRDLSAGTTALASVSSSGVQANGFSSNQTLSSDGRYVAFMSGASNLVPGDTNGMPDVFVHDMVSGETTRANVSSAGAQANGYSGGLPRISTDGRYVAFHSLAANLVPGDTNGESDVFVRDLVSGTTTRMSVTQSGQQVAAASSYPAMSADGRYFAFLSSATDLVASDTGADDAFVIDRMRAGSSIALSSASATISAGATRTVAGSLNSSGTPLAGRRVVLESAVSESGPWSETSSEATTAADGAFSLPCVPTVGTWYRAAFFGEGLVYDASQSSACLAVSAPPQPPAPVVRVSLGNPVAPRTLRAKRVARVYGFLKPRHTAGTSPVQIYLYFCSHGKWNRHGHVKAKVTDYATYSKYSASVTLRMRGRWRLRAYYPAHPGYAAGWSEEYAYVRVK